MAVLPATWLILGLAWLSSAAESCPDGAEPRQPPFEITIPAGQWLHAELAEDGTDWVLVGIAGGQRFEHDSAPSRLASERLLLPGAWFPVVRIEARAYGRHEGPPPSVRVHCDALSSADEPRSRKLEGQPEDFDPLAETITCARLFDVEVHAWLNVNYIWPGPEMPPMKQHIANRLAA